MTDVDFPGQTKYRIQEAVEIIKDSRYLVAYTGAGISVESGIPPFRGPDGLWSSYDPKYLELTYFHQHPKESWWTLKSIFYEHFTKAEPKDAHRVLAFLEKRDWLKAVITQNIDNLHQLAGSAEIIEFHGNSRDLICVSCGVTTAMNPDILLSLPPGCECAGVLKPDCIFFGEEVLQGAWIESKREIEAADVLPIVDSTGEVYPAGTALSRIEQLLNA
jgi:NAD-dependent deacetylase